MRYCKGLLWFGASGGEGESLSGCARTFASCCLTAIDRFDTDTMCYEKEYPWVDSG